MLHFSQWPNKVHSETRALLTRLGFQNNSSLCSCMCTSVLNVCTQRSGLGIVPAPGFALALVLTLFVCLPSLRTPFILTGSLCKHLSIHPIHFYEVPTIRLVLCQAKPHLTTESMSPWERLVLVLLLPQVTARRVKCRLPVGQQPAVHSSTRLSRALGWWRVLSPAPKQSTG